SAVSALGSRIRLLRAGSANTYGVYSGAPFGCVVSAWRRARREASSGNSSIVESSPAARASRQMIFELYCPGLPSWWLGSDAAVSAWTFWTGSPLALSELISTISVALLTSSWVFGTAAAAMPASEPLASGVATTTGRGVAVGASAGRPAAAATGVDRAVAATDKGSGGASQPERSSFERDSSPFGPWAQVRAPSVQPPVRSLFRHAINPPVVRWSASPFSGL